MGPVQRFMELLLPVHVLLPLLGGTLRWALQKRTGARNDNGQPLLVLFLLLNLCTSVLLGWNFWGQGTGLSGIQWTASLPLVLFESGVLDQLSLRLDALGWPLIVLLPCVAMTSQVIQAFRKVLCGPSPLAMLVGVNLLLLGDDVMTLMTGATITVAAFAWETGSSGGRLSRLTFYPIGWFAVFAGLAWLTASAATVRAAPHGLPGQTTTGLFDLVQLLQRAAGQHPAARLAWEQLQALPTLSLLLGVAVVAGLVPLHRSFATFLANGSLHERLWGIVIAKGALILLVKLLVLPSPADWGRFAQPFSPYVLLGFMYCSLLLLKNSEADLRLGRVVIWSQQVTFFGVMVHPEAALSVLLLSEIVHVAGLVLLCLDDEQVGRSPGVAISIPALLGVLSLSVTPGAAGMVFLWQATLQMSIDSTKGGLLLVLFLAFLLVSNVGLTRFLRPDADVAAVAELRKDWKIRGILCIWGLVAILGSFVVPVLASVESVVAS